MRGLLNLFSVGRWRPAPPVQAQPAEPASMLHVDALVLDRLLRVTFENGVREERARIEAITKMPSAERFPRLASSLAFSGVITLAQAAQTLADAESDVLARLQPTESILPDVKVLH